MELMTVLTEQPGRMHGWKANGIFSKLWIRCDFYIFIPQRHEAYGNQTYEDAEEMLYIIWSPYIPYRTHTPPSFFIYLFFFPSIYYTASNIWNKWSLTSDFALFLTSLIQIFLTLLGTARYLGHACALQEKQAFDPTHPFAWFSWNL